MTKALLYELGKSKSYGRLSLAAKVLWPMLLATSDDQGRGQADPDAIKWYVCPNVQEITQEEIPGLLEEMQAQGMILLYGDPNEPLYQVINWWEYQRMQWAHPSKYPAPENWADRLRYNVRGGGYFEENWKGARTPTEEAQEETHVEPLPDFPPGNPPGKSPGLPTKLNLTQLNSTTTQPNLTEQESSPPTAEIATPPPQKKPKPKQKRKPPEETILPDTPEARVMFAKLAANARARGRRAPTRFGSLEQKRKFISAVARLDGRFEEALDAGLGNSITAVGKLVNYIASPKWQEPQQKRQPRGSPKEKELPLDVRVQQEEIRRQLGRGDE